MEPQDRSADLLVESVVCVTDVAGKADRGTRQTCKRGQEWNEDGTRLDKDWTRRYFVSRNTRQDRNKSKGRNV